MAFLHANRARMTTLTTGTGTLTLNSAESGYQSFAAAGIADGDTFPYLIEDGSAWEVGIGTYTASGTTMSRSVLESTNSDTAISLTGNAVVSVVALASILDDMLRPSIAAQLAAAFTGTVTDDGTKSSGTYTPSPASGGQYKKCVNGGAFTLAPYSPGTNEAVTLSLLIVNNGSAGAITTSGFTMVTGDAFDTTDTNKFLCRIECVDYGGTEVSTLDVVALQ